MGKKLNLTEEEKQQKMVEKKLKKKEYAAGYYQKHKEEKAQYYQQHKDESKERRRESRRKYRESHKEQIKEKNRIYELNHKKEKKEYRESRKEETKIYMKIYNDKNKIILNEKKKKFRDENKEYIKLSKHEAGLRLKERVLNILGGCKCVVCGCENIRYLTIDHIDPTGYLDRKSGLGGSKIYQNIVNGTYPIGMLSNLRVACYNHNLGRRKDYLDIPYEQQSSSYRYYTKLWKAAFNFFGPCPCGESDLKFLTVSHIHDDGAERRRNGEGTGTNILYKIRKLGWPESIKRDLCLECYNCNCSRRYKY